MEVAKDFLSPEVNAAFAGITVREFDDGDSLGPEKKEKGDAPEPDRHPAVGGNGWDHTDRKSTRLNSSHGSISYAVFCLKKKNTYMLDIRITIMATMPRMNVIG